MSTSLDRGRSPGASIGIDQTPAQPARRLSYDWVKLAGGLFVVLDLASLLLATLVSTLLYNLGSALDLGVPASLAGIGRAAYLPALLAPFLLYEKRLGSLASRGPLPYLARAHALRFTLLASVLLLLGAVSGSSRSVPARWLVLWFGSALLFTSITRLVLARGLRYLQRRGYLREVIAVVGAGPIADRLVETLRQTPSDSVDFIGVFDDRSRRADDHQVSASGTLAQLMELGTSRRIDWILLTLPPDAQPRISAILQRLMALSAPIALYPLRTDVSGAAERGDLEFDNHDLESFARIAARFGQQQYGFAVTPNADHIIRLHEDGAFRALYAAASFVLLDSRFIARILQFVKRVNFPVCTGSDLTERLLSRVASPDDGIVLVGGTAEQAQTLARRYGLSALHHYNPPMGFIQDPQAVQHCLEFIESHSPFRFCLLAVGSPQQEIIANSLKERGIARGLALCIGASVDFLTGVESRAPAWMQSGGLEWLHRLSLNPGRLGWRYLVRGPRVFGVLLVRRMRLRGAVAPSLAQVSAATSAPVDPVR